MKLSKARLKTHAQACALVDRHHDPEGAPLTDEDRRFIIDHWEPGAEHAISWIDAFFTPAPLAEAMMIETLNCHTRSVQVLDLCAGIGALSFAYHQRHRWDQYQPSLTCLERNPHFLRVGQATAPTAHWILGDMEDHATLLAGRRFDQLLTNPPFGKSGALAYRTMEIGMTYCRYGTAILPQTCLTWSYSGGSYTYRDFPNPKSQKWQDTTGLDLRMNCGIDTKCVEDGQFRDTDITVEIVCIETRDPVPSASHVEDDADDTLIEIPTTQQLTLFAS